MIILHQRAFAVFLSILILIPAVSAIVIEEIDSGETTTITATGTNIDVAQIEAHIDQRTAEIAESIQQNMNAKLSEYEAKADQLLEKFFVKMGLGITTICLFIFNFSIATKIFIGDLNG